MESSETETGHESDNSTTLEAAIETVLPDSASESIKDSSSECFSPVGHANYIDVAV